MPKVLIVGGGISGLSAAYYLNKAGVRATLVEKAQHLGGVIRTSVQQGCLLEEGPDSFMAAKPWAMELIREVGLGDQVIGSNDHLRVTYILKHGKLVPLPDGLMMMVPTKIMPLVGTRLLSWGTKIRMGLELLRRPPKAPLADRSVYDFLLDHYGQESIDYLAEPLLAGVYGGDPREMSVNSVLARFVEIESKYGSLTRGVLAAPRPKGSGSGSLFRTLKNGLGQLVDALQPSADILQGSVESLERANRGFRARVNGNWLDADQVVLATPAGDAARLLQPWNGELAALLQAIPYTSSITMSLGYRKDTFDHPLNGFGFLVPKRERKFMAACTWVGNKFSYRVPDDMVLLRCFMGGNALGQSDEALVEAAKNELRSIMGLQASPVFHNIARWPNAMAQYTVGHEKRQQQVESIVKGIPGLHLAGNGYRGIGLPDCIRAGKDAATRIVSN
ncbi:MAG TPA: protoporphyrinogen oxidase [Bryobacteraceae bacterium]|nr:protoporphyrinogen oxidase [Bryobacteraceae bacterium]